MRNAVNPRGLLGEVGRAMPAFIPGLVLAERFYREAVRPILDAEFPGLSHSAGLMGSGSEVLGFDTPVSSDHGWGPRVELFLIENDHARYAQSVRDELGRRLPHEFLGWPTNFTEPNLEDHGTQRMRSSTDGPINHRVEVATLQGFFYTYLGFDIGSALDPVDWLTFPSQKLRTIRTGGVFYDAIGLEAVRARFAWYPQDVWLYQLAAGWQRIGQEEHLMGRAGQVGDEIGSALIAGRLVRDLMRLCFLMERQYAPYPKWYGTAFAQLEAARLLSSPLRRVLRAETWLDRDRALGEAYSMVGRLHNACDLTEPLSVETVQFFGRPFSVIFGERIARALSARLQDPRIRRIPLLIGGLDQWSDSTDVLEAAALRSRFKVLYGKPD